MTTENKIEANRLNAQKSTGPRTPEGKARSAQNAVTHGLCSARPVLAVEDKEEFNDFANDFIRNLDPLNPVEEFLSRRIACLAWRLQRAARYETLVLDNLCKTSASDPGQSADEALGQILTDDFRNQRTLEKIQSYEARLECSILRCTKQLRVFRDPNLNFTDVREYIRGYEPRDPYFKDEPNTTAIPQNEPNTDEAAPLRDAVAEAPSVAAVLQNEPKIENRQSSIENPQNEPNAENLSCSTAAPGCVPVIPEHEEPAHEGTQNEPKLENRQSSIENLRNEPKLTSNAGHSEHSEESLTSNFSLLPSPCHQQNEPKIENHQSSIENRNTSPQKWPKDWAKLVLDKLHYPPHKRRMSWPKLNELADSVLMDLKDPEQFMQDLIAERAARQRSYTFSVSTY